MANLLGTGLISLAGTTANRSIQLALNGNGSTQISFNTVGVLALRQNTTQTNIIMPTDFYSKNAPTSRAIFGFGNTAVGTTGSPTAVTNLVSTAGVVATDTAGVGTARNNVAACTYGFDKGIVGFGFSTAVSGLTNLISNAGVVATDTAAVGTARQGVAACGYGETNGYFFGGFTSTVVSNQQNLVGPTGVVGTTTTALGTARIGGTGVNYGATVNNTGIIYGGSSTAIGGTYYNISNLINFAGQMAGDVTAAGTARTYAGSSGYGFDKAIFQSGNFSGTVAGTSNLVSNTGVIAANTTAVGNSVFFGRAGSTYGFTGQGLIGYGGNGTIVTNFASTITNTGVANSGVAVAGTSRQRLACCGFGIQQA